MDYYAGDMFKTFVMSPIAGALAAVLGWIGAGLFKSSMSTAEFADLRFGWEGAMVGAIALAAITILTLTKGVVDPLVLVGSAAVGAAVLWNKQDASFATNNFRDGTTPSYWFTVTMMVVILILLLMGLRGVRESKNSARS